MKRATERRLQKGFWSLLFLAVACLVTYRVVVPHDREAPARSAAALRAEKGLPVRTWSVEALPWRRWKSAYGKVRAATVQEISSFLREVIVHVPVDVGEEVRPGEILVELSRQTQSAALKARLAEIGEAERDYRRRKALVEAGGMAGKELDTASVLLETLRSSLAEVRSTLERTRVRAQRRAVVVMRDAEVGEVAEGGRILLRLADLESLEVEALIAPGDLFTVGSGTRAEIIVDGPTVEGSVKRVDPEADEATGLYRAVVSLEGERFLRPGTYVEVRFLVDDRPDVVAVPYEAIRRESGRTYLFVVSGDRAFRRDFQAGSAQEGLVEIPAGLDVGEAVVVEGMDGLYDGARVWLDGDNEKPESDRE